MTPATVAYRIENGTFVRDVRLPRKNAVTRSSVVMPTDDDYEACILAWWDGNDQERVARNWCAQGLGQKMQIVITAGRTVPAWVMQLPVDRPYLLVDDEQWAALEHLLAQPVPATPKLDALLAAPNFFAS